MAETGHVLELLIVAGLFSIAIALGTAAFFLVKREGRLTPTAATLTPAHEERVAALERAFPAWKLEMEHLADEAAEILGAAERKRRAARMHETRARGEASREAGDGNEGEAAGGLQNAGAVPENVQRAIILRQVRARRGNR